MRGGHAQGRGYARWGPSRGHGMLVWPSPAMQWDKSILLREALGTGIESLLKSGLCMLVLPTILQQVVQQSGQEQNTSVQCAHTL